MVKRTITILSGLPGAGKSVYSKTFSEDENTVIIEVDKFRTKDEGYSFSRLSELEVFRKVYRDIALLINNPSSECEHIIIDDVFPTEKSRGTIRALAYTYGWDVDVVYFAADADECYENRKKNTRGISENVWYHVIHTLSVLFESPNPDRYNKITIINGR